MLDRKKQKTLQTPTILCWIPFPLSLSPSLSLCVKNKENLRARKTSYFANTGH